MPSKFSDVNIVIVAVVAILRSVFFVVAVVLLRIRFCCYMDLSVFYSLQLPSPYSYSLLLACFWFLFSMLNDFGPFIDLCMCLCAPVKLLCLSQFSVQSESVTLSSKNLPAVQFYSTQLNSRFGMG